MTDDVRPLTEPTRRPRVLVLAYTDISRDPRVLRHVEALAPDLDVITCGKGAMLDGVVQHLRIPDDATALPLDPVGLTALAVRAQGLALTRVAAAAEAVRLAAGVSFDVVLANDAITLPAALRIAAGRPVVADLHEFAPLEMEEDWRWRLMLAPLARHLCRRFLPAAAAVTTVSPGLAARYAQEYGVHPTVVTNAGHHRTDQDTAPSHHPLRLVHSGNANPDRRLETMVEAAGGLAGVELDLYLTHSTHTEAYRRRLSEQADATPNVRVLEPVPMDEIVPTMRGYHVGLYSLAPTSFNNLHALPNKFFDFVQAGLAIVVGPSPDMAALVAEHRLGTVAAGFDASALRTTLAGLTPARVDTWRAATRSAAAVLCAEVEAGRLRKVLAGTLPTGAAGRT